MLPWWSDVILLLSITCSGFWSLTPLLYYPQNSLKHTFEIHSSMLWPESISCMQSTMQDWRDSFMLFKSAASHTSTPDTRGTCNKTIKNIPWWSFSVPQKIWTIVLSVFTHVACIYANLLLQKKAFAWEKSSIPQRIGLGHPHGRRFIVWGHQYGRRDVMWKHSILASGSFVEIT